MLGHSARQDMIEGYGLRETWARVDAEALAQKVLRTREDAEDVEGRLTRLYYLAQARMYEAEAGAARYMVRVYADDQERHRAERDGREPHMNTLLQQRPPGSSMAWGQLLRAYLFMTALVALLFAALSALNVVGGVTIALTWPAAQAAILCGLWWAARRGRTRS